MGWKRIIVSSISMLLFFWLGAVSSQESDDDIDAVMSVVVDFILNSEQQNQNLVEFDADGEVVNFQVPGINLNSVSECVTSRELPLGLVLQVNANQTGCEIVGIPTQIVSLFSTTVIASNDFGNQSSSNLSISVNPASTISGLVTYDRVPVNSIQGLDFTNIRQEPVRNVVVELLDGTGNILQTSTTDFDGRYSFEESSNDLRRVRVKAQIKQISTSEANYDVVVVDNTNSGALYSLTEAQASSMTTNPVRNLNAGSGWSIAANAYTGTRSAAPFAILDSILDAMEVVINVDFNVTFPDLVINWSSNNSISAPLLGESEIQSRAAGRIGASFYVFADSIFDPNPGEIFLLGDIDTDSDEFDSHVVIHEWGHYFEDRISRSDSIGGSHTIESLLDLRLAFSEGFGNAISAIATDDSVYVDTFTFFGFNLTIDFDIEENNVENPGWYSEASVQSILYDIYDNNNDGEDDFSLGFGPIYEVMVGEDHVNTDAFTSIFSFASAFNETAVGSSFSVGRTFDDLLDGQSIEPFVITEFGSFAENNFAGLPSIDFRPVYESVTLTQPTASFISTRDVCTTTEFIEDDGETNKLFNSAFVQFEISDVGDYIVTIEEDQFSTDYASTLPTGIVYRKGEFLGFATSTGEDDLFAFRINLTEPGIYILEVFDNNIESNVGFTGQACFDVGVIAP